MSRLDYSKALFGDGMRRAVYSESVGVTTAIGESSQTNMRYGTVMADAVLDELTGKRSAEIILDGSDASVVLSCDTPLKKDDRVAVLITGTNTKVIPLGDRILDEAQLNAESYFNVEKDKIESGVKEMLYDEEGNPIYATSSSLRETADEIRSEVKGELYDENGNKIYAASSTISQTVDGLVKEYTKDISDTANNAMDAAEDAQDTANSIKTIIRESIYGIDVGKENGELIARVGSDATFELINSDNIDVFSVFHESGTTYISGNKNRDLKIVSGTYTSSSSPSIDFADGIEVSGGSGSINLSATSGRVYKDTAGYSSFPTSGDPVVAGARLLYSSSSGETGSVYLNDYVYNYAAITIFFADDKGRLCSQMVYSPNGKSTALHRTVYGSSVIYNQGEIVTISGSTISRGSNGEADIHTGSTGVTSGKDFWIRYVIGWTG